MDELLARVRRMFSGRRDVPTAPEGTRIYAVGDIHGCAREFDSLMALILEDAKDWSGKRELIFLGDYIDRGPDSRGVIERLLAPPKGFSVTHLRGNHDQALLDFLEEPAFFGTWRDFGARETLMSYGVTPPRFDDPNAFGETRDRLQLAIPRTHLEFLASLPLFAKSGGYYFVHAGVRAGVALDRQTPEDLMWIRDEFLLSDDDFGMVVVHGHTPTREPVLRANRIGIDTGAYATGKLTAAVLEGSGCRFLASTGLFAISKSGTEFA